MNPESLSVDLTPAESAVLKRAEQILLRKLRRRGDVLSSPNLVRALLRCLLAAEEREVFLVIFVDSHNCFLGAEPLFAGTLTQTSVHPREVVKAALAMNAAGVLLAHYVARYKMRIMCPGSSCSLAHVVH